MGKRDKPVERKGLHGGEVLCGGEVPMAGHGHLLGSDKQMSTGSLVLFLCCPMDCNCAGETYEEPLTV